MTESNHQFRGKALLITVNENRDSQIGSLGDPVLADGDAVEQALLDEDVCGYGRANVTRLSGKDASLVKITSTLDTLAGSVGENDPFLLYFSGHGGVTNEGTILAPYDAASAIQSGLLTSDQLADSLRRLPSKRKLVIIDACHAGGLNLSGGLAKSAKSLSNAVLSSMAAGEGVVVIASSRSSEVSYIRPGDPLSLFTKHFVSAMRGAGGHDASGFVRVFDLFNYVAERVRQEEPRQAPVYAAHHQDLNFPVAFCAATEKRVKAPQFTLSDHNGRHSELLLQTLCDLYPLGPSDQDIWLRAGGDLSRLNLAGSGRLTWMRAFRYIEQGASVSASKVINAAYDDYPMNRRLQILSDYFK